MNEIENSKGSIYEYDVITWLIELGVKRLQEKAEVALVIDDLDRIDPEHIFRILNVFAAHFDDSKSDKANKFGLDRIILVCDIGNIRKIFSNKYGMDVDFDGYIDKFYSKEVFHFDNSENLKSIVKEIQHSIKTHIFNEIELSLNNYLKSNIINSEILTKILSHLIECEAISLRSLLRYYKSTIQFDNKAIVFWNTGVRIDNWKCSMVMILDVLYKLFGDYHHLVRGIEKCKGLQINIDVNVDLLEETVLLLEYGKHVFGRTHPTLQYVSKDLILAPITYSIERLGNRAFRCNFESGFKQKLAQANVQYFRLLGEAAEILHKSNYLK